MTPPSPEESHAPGNDSTCVVVYPEYPGGLSRAAAAAATHGGTTPVRPAALRGRLGQRGKATYTERMAKTGRPISPHITIYAFPTIAWSSIGVRGCGMLLSAGAPAPRFSPP